MAGEEGVTGEGGTDDHHGVMDGSEPRGAEGAAIPRMGRRRGPRGGNRLGNEPVVQWHRGEEVEGRPKRTVRLPQRFLE